MPSDFVLTPYALALVVCDYVYEDYATGKKTIIGTFSALGANKFPTVHPIMAVYATLTDGRGKMEVRLELIDVDEEREPIFKEEMEMNFHDPRLIIEMVFYAQNIQFNHPGEYRLKLYANHDFLVERRIIVMDARS